MWIPTRTPGGCRASRPCRRGPPPACSGVCGATRPSSRARARRPRRPSRRARPEPRAAPDHRPRRRRPPAPRPNPSATPDRTAGLSAMAMGKTWIETSPNATLRLFVAMSASSMCSERWAGRGADGATRRGFGFFAHELIKRATLSRGMSSRFLPYGPASSRSA